MCIAFRGKHLTFLTDEFTFLSVVTGYSPLSLHGHKRLFWAMRLKILFFSTVMHLNVSETRYVSILHVHSQRHAKERNSEI